MTRRPFYRPALKPIAGLVWGLALWGGMAGVQAASTDISAVPLITSKTAAKPNVLFILDDSGSMSSNYMPDDMSNTNAYGFTAAQCNGLAYNPKLVYAPPSTADGRAFPGMSLTATWDDGFVPAFSSSTTSSTSVTLPSGTPFPSSAITFNVGSVTNIAVGDTLAVVSNTDTSRWMLGTVTSVVSSTRMVTITPSFSTSTGSYNSWKMGRISTTSQANKTYYNYSGSEPALNWTYSSSGVDTSTTFYKQCNSQLGNSPGSAVFALATITTGSSDAVNYANWYSYYRKRILSMKTTASRSFVALDANKRVGFTTISDSTVSTSSTFLNVSDFDLTQKWQFFSDLFQTQPGSYTPLRGALAKAGRYYAKKNSAQTYDPVQYACQRNYAVLSTDGYWNTHDETSTYGPIKLDGSTVGQQDGSEVRPMYDGAQAVVTTVTVTTKRSPQETVDTYKQTTKVWEHTGYTSRSGGSCFGSTPYAYTAQKQRQTETITTKNTVVSDVTRTSTHTVVSTGGVVTSDTTTPYTTLGTPTVVSTTNNQPVSDTSTSWANYASSSTGCSSTAYTSTPNYTSSTLISTAGPTTSSTSTTDGVQPIITPGTPQVTNSSTGGAINALADVAEYYYTTDLRNSALGNCTGSMGVDVCSDDVTVADRDNATWQHLTTFTIGLGVSGTLDYDADYLTQTTGTYVNLKSGAVNWPVPSETSGGGSATNVDDLWHAAVNGRGQYFAATDPNALSNAINGIFKSVDAANGAGTSAATSSLEPVAGNDQIYLATYTTQDWTGEIKAFNFSVDSQTGTVSTTDAWSAQSGLDALTSATAATRRIYYMRGSTSRSLQSFTYTNLSADGYGAYFSNFCSQSLTPTQCSALTNTLVSGGPSQLSTANNGSNLVNFLRGDSAYQVSTNSLYPLYRDRAHKLGDIVGGSPVFVGTPVFNYGDAGYAAYKTAQSTRKPMLYIAANDGMLHAFSAAAGVDAGTELWAFVPSMVMPNLYRLADTNYANRHLFFVDAPPVVSDIQVNGSWKTILVGGLGAGGKGYYALDITDPVNPQALWEFTDTHLGLSYGSPIITKRADGTWVVVFGSGINNNAGSGDGNGHLFMLNASTGAKLLDIPTYTSGTTPAGSNSTPSGLVKLNAWVPDQTNNTALRFYGGDLQGNVWRFDTDGLIEPKNKALLLAQLQTNSTTPQPVSTRIELAEVNYNNSTYPVILVGTGRYLGVSDLLDTTQQSVYAIKDPLTSTGWGAVHGNSNIVQQTLSVSGSSATVSSNAVDWSSKIGWSIDLPGTSERVSVDMSLQYNALAVITSEPSTDTCAASGVSWLYYFSLNSGGSVATSGSGAGEKMGNYLGMGLTWVELSDGTSRLLIPASNATLQIKKPQVSPSSESLTPHRTSWRELNN